MEPAYRKIDEGAMYRFIAIASMCFFLAACAGRVIKEEMTGLIGQPLDAAIAKLGVPTEERTIAGRKVYIWFSGTFDEGTQLKCQIRVIMNGNVIGSYDF